MPTYVEMSPDVHSQVAVVCVLYYFDAISGPEREMSENMKTYSLRTLGNILEWDFQTPLGEKVWRQLPGWGDSDTPF